ncbi:ABC transporter permease [Salsipaludibacter albus]|uniref:ABC transporter permease n=1 Tax=Salsipaludibacter albus TaxID=2849650 RepID=UPI001EE4619E|nr:iron ABC transporter permease [Salsipaludibacter albus]MBY5163435.1 iron ABC transporter permease [Salsipaludibacter albus]
MSTAPATEATPAHAPLPPAPGSARRRGDGRRGWRLATGVIAVLVVLPVALVAGSILTPSLDVWRFLVDAGLGSMVVSTVVLMVGVVAGTTVLGAGLAWLVSTYTFPGRRAFAWLLVLPLAVPSYVLAFVAVSLLDAPGPLQTFARDTLGWSINVAAPQGMGIAIVVMSLALYPYVYLLARAALAEQGATTYLAARTLGRGPMEAARRVVLPLARPSLAAAGALVAMETLTDFATIQYFNVQTVSVAIYQVWNGMFDRAAATELAALVLVFAVTIILVERAMRGRARYSQSGGQSPTIEPVHLAGWKRWAATGVCTLVVGVAFVAPVLRLVTWSSISVLQSADGGFDPRYLGYLGNSVMVAVITAVACVAVAAVVVNAARLTPDRLTRTFARLTTIGYAVPGPVVAIGVLLSLAGIDAVLDAAGIGWGAALVTGSVVGLVIAYVIRFLALATNSMEASLDKVTRSTTSSALSLGASPARVVRRIHLPLMRSGVGVALVLVAVDALKELPVVLLLRPFGFSTLAVWVYELASESLWNLVGLPALTIVVVASIPVLLLFRAQVRVPRPGEAS